MMRLSTLAFALLAVPLQPQAPTDAQIQSVMAGVLSGKLSMYAGCNTGGAFAATGFTVRLIGPLDRVFQAAVDARRKYLPFALADVTPEMRNEVVTLTAVPFAPHSDSGHYYVTADATHAVIKTKYKFKETAKVLQPTSHELFAVDYANAVGGKFQIQGVRATFTLDAIRAFAPKGFDVAIVTDRREELCTIKDTRKIQ